MIVNKSQNSINAILTNKWLKAKIIKGAGRGKKIGFPTINLKLINQSSGLKSSDYGVYICQVKFLSEIKKIKNNYFYGLLHFGPQAVFGKTKPVLEIYILNFSKAVAVGNKIKFRLIKFLRPTKKFTSVKKLAAQIEKDEKKAKTELNIK
jgi:riboflavin kinase / FMN adenylyltransferase